MKIRKTNHGWTNTPTYRTWAIMKTRCNNAFDDNYMDYGEKGIRVCKRWHDFRLFLEDMGPKPAGLSWLIRIDKKGDYCPENCKWIIKRA